MNKQGLKNLTIMRIILIIILLFPLMIYPQRPDGGGRGNSFKGFNKEASKNHFRGNISGKIIDSKSGNPLEFANISVTNIKWNKLIEGTIGFRYVT